jgi:tyrosine-protein phosphatase SIW14
MIREFWRFLGVAALLVGGTAWAGSSPQGVPNFHQVNDQIFRGAQPTDEGFRNLAKLGIKTVIDLREADDRSMAEKRVVEAAGMRYVSVPMRGMHTPTDEQVSQVLKLFDDRGAGPVFVHCRRGADRTGAVVACYRIGHDGWDNQKALGEAKSLGMSWMQRALQSYVLQYRPQQSVATAGAAAPSAPALAPGLAVAP